MIERLEIERLEIERLEIERLEMLGYGAISCRKVVSPSLGFAIS